MLIQTTLIQTSSNFLGDTLMIRNVILLTVLFVPVIARGIDGPVKAPAEAATSNMHITP